MPLVRGLKAWAVDKIGLLMQVTYNGNFNNWLKIKIFMSVIDLR